jgi:hypothetical protein
MLIISDWMMKTTEVTALRDCFMVAVTLNAFSHRHSGRRVNHQNNAQTQNENPHRLLLPLRTRF